MKPLFERLRRGGATRVRIAPPLRYWHTCRASVPERYYVDWHNPHQRSRKPGQPSGRALGASRSQRTGPESRRLGSQSQGHVGKASSDSATASSWMTTRRKSAFEKRLRGNLRFHRGSHTTAVFWPVLGGHRSLVVNCGASPSKLPPPLQSGGPGIV